MWEKLPKYVSYSLNQDRNKTQHSAGPKVQAHTFMAESSNKTTNNYTSGDSATHTVSKEPRRGAPDFTL